MVLPDKVNVIEVGPRDGFQNLKTFIPTETKIKEIELLIDSGIKEIEITSFVHPKAIPQMADAAEVAQTVTKKYGDSIKPTALIPNIKGAELALECGITDVAYVISVSEAHNKNNINRTVEESLSELKTLIATYPRLNVRLDAATSFGCPFQGSITPEEVISFLKKAVACGISGIMLCDTIGIANPKQTKELSERVLKEFPYTPVGLHMHDTRGMGLANILAGMTAGITDFETSVGGLGGCPFAPGAAGNTATEDLIHMLQAMGIDTGVNLDKYMSAALYVKQNIQSDLTGHMANVCEQ